MPEQALLELFIQGGVGVGALVVMLIFGQRVLKAAKEQLDAALKARDRDQAEAREERRQMLEAFRAESSAQREVMREIVRDLIAAQSREADRIIAQVREMVGGRGGG